MMVAGSTENWAGKILRTGRILAWVGVVLPLLMIGGLKFTPAEIEGLRPLISGTPWLGWLYPTLGVAGASYFLGVFELAAAFLLLLSPWIARAGVIGGAMAAFTLLVTSSLLIALPVWDPAIGFPALNAGGQFLIKDIALLGIALVILGESLIRVDPSAKRRLERSDGSV